MANRKSLEEMALALAAKSLNKNSKFYSDDIAALKSNIARKTDGELTEMIDRQKAINEVGKHEINTHCQFK